MNIFQRLIQILIFKNLTGCVVTFSKMKYSFYSLAVAKTNIFIYFRKKATVLLFLTDVEHKVDLFTVK